MAHNLPCGLLFWQFKKFLDRSSHILSKQFQKKTYKLLQSFHMKYFSDIQFPLVCKFSQGRNFPLNLFFFVVIFLGTGLWVETGSATEIQGDWEKGKRIFLKGVGNDPISAYLSGPGIKTSAEGFACVQCHKETGKGGREGGVFIPDISFQTLTNEQVGTHPTARHRPAYTLDTLAQAIQTGKDPAGNSLHSAMPRYILELGDLKNLIAYLKILGEDPVPGVSDTMLRVGILLPGSGPLQKTGQEVASLLSAMFEKINQRGGYYGRRLKLKPIALDPGAMRSNQIISQIEKELKTESIFCFIANLGVPYNSELSKYLSLEDYPVIFPLALSPPKSFGPSANTFYLYAGLLDQGRTLVDFQSKKNQSTPGSLALIYSEDAYSKDGAKGIKKQILKHSKKISLERIYSRNNFDPAQLAIDLKKHSVRHVFFMGSGREANALIFETTHLKWKISLYTSMDLVGTSLFTQDETALAQIFLASTSNYPSKDPKTFQDFFALLDASKVSRGNLAFKRTAYSGGLILEEGLKRSGRKLTQIGFINELNQLWRWSSGLTPEITYNQNRRVGSLGAGVLRVDLQNKRFVQVWSWQNPEK